MIADAVEHMLASGMSHEAVVAIVRAIETHGGILPGTPRQERNRRHYERLKASESVLIKTDETPKETPHTPQEIYNIYTPTEANASVPPKPKNGTRLPENWHPHEGLWAWGKDKLGLPEDVLRFETGSFRDHFWGKSGAAANKVNWDSAWKNWMREAVRRRGKGSGPPRQKFSPSMEAMTRLTKEMQERENGFSSNVIDIARNG